MAYALPTGPRDLSAEQRFRRWTANQDRRLMIFLVATVAVAAMVFGALDLAFFDDGMRNGETLACRISILVTSLAAVAVLRRPRRPQVFDWYVVVWMVSVLSMQVGVAMLRPEHWSPVQIVNMLLVLGAYTLLPIPTRLIAVPVQLFSAINLLILTRPFGGFPGRIEFAVMAAYVVANVIGLVVARRVAALRRRQFRVLDREREARRRLRSALDEVKVLRGIVPICSVCKKIRNDGGAYEPLESFLTRHSEADFSHTLCPNCLHEQYPDEAGMLTP